MITMKRLQLWADKRYDNGRTVNYWICAQDEDRVAVAFDSMDDLDRLMEFLRSLSNVNPPLPPHKLIDYLEDRRSQEPQATAVAWIEDEAYSQFQHRHRLYW